MTNVSFPGLGIEEFTLNPAAITFGESFSIHWYGILIAVGIALAFLYAFYRSRFEGVKFDDLLDITLFTVVFAVIGARLFYVMFAPSEFKNFLDVIAIWSGGLAIYGAVIAGAITIAVVCRIKKISTLKVLDFAAPAVMIGQIIGRWGNFVNVEAYGTETTLPWRMGILSYSGWSYVHPTFLYESLWNLVGFILINTFYGWKTKKTHQKYDGQIFLMVFTWYGFGRMLIEGLRTDSLYVGPFRISQVLGGLFFLVGLGLLLYHHFTKTDMLFQPLAEKKEG